MNFRTIIEVENGKLDISHNDKIFMMGSCFVQSMAEKMMLSKMNVCVNPFGVLYNPISILKSIEILESGYVFTERELMSQNDVWFSMKLHSCFSSINKNEVLHRANTQAQIARKALLQAKYIMVTLGTSWVYEYKETGEIVSNCHKLAASSFNRYSLEMEDIVSAFSDFIKIHADKKIIFTLSPIRHTKDALVENSLSKSTLRLAIDRLTKRFNNVQYFPSYEIMMDDLRDYRFYSSDMVHPSAVAEDYIWNKFSDYAFSDKTKEIIKRIQKIDAAMSHRPFNPESETHEKFKLAQLREIENIKTNYKEIDFIKEIKYFSE